MNCNQLVFIFAAVLSIVLCQQDFTNRPLYTTANQVQIASVPQVHNSGGGGGPTSSAKYTYFFNAFDYNRDGIMDNAAIYQQDQTLYVCINSNVATPVYSCQTANQNPFINVAGMVSGTFTYDYGEILVADNSSTIYQYRVLSNGSSIQTGVFGPPMNAGCVPVKLFAADFNYDGIKDVALGCSSGSVYIWINDGISISSKVPYIANLGRTISDFEMADLNSDGKMDIAAITSLSNNMSVIYSLQTSNFTFSAVTTLYTQSMGGVSPSDPHPKIKAKDCNFDGLADIAAMFPQVIYIFANTYSNPGSFSITYNRTLSSASDRYYDFDALDLDGNGSMDLPFMYSSPSVVATQMAIDNNTIAIAVLYDIIGMNSNPLKTPLFYYGINGNQDQTSPVGGNPINLYFADINADGRLDLIVKTSVYLYALLGTSTSAYSGPLVITSYGSTSATYQLLCDDINGDGLDDLIVVNAINSRTIGYDTYLNQGKLGIRFARTEQIFSSNTSTSFLADVNGDGFLDIVVQTPGSSANTDYIYCYYGFGNGTFNSTTVNTGTVTNIFGSILISNVVNSAISDIFYVKRTGQIYDLKRRHYANSQWTESTVLSSLQQQISEFVLPNNNATGTITLYAQDINNDGLQDIVVAFVNRIPGTLGSSCYFIRQTATNVFDSPVLLYASQLGYLTALTFADMNNDGVLDFIFSVDGASEMHIVYLNADLDGSYQTAVVANSNNSPPNSVPVLYAVDIDANNLTDLIYMNAGNINGFQQQPDNSFQTLASFPTYANGINIISLVISDIDGDGDFDFLALLSLSNTVYLVVVKNKDSAVKLIPQSTNLTSYGCAKAATSQAYFIPCSIGIKPLDSPYAFFTYRTKYFLYPGATYRVSSLKFISQTIGTSTLPSASFTLESGLPANGKVNKWGKVTYKTVSASANIICTSSSESCVTISYASAYFSDIAFSSSTSTTSSCFKITNGYPVILNNIRISNFISTQNGGAINAFSSQVILLNSILSSNSAIGNGGGIYMNASTCTIYSSTIMNNWVRSNNSLAGSSLTGGGVKVDSYPVPTFANGLVYFPTVPLITSNTLTVYNSLFHNNSAAKGGAIHAQGGNVIDKSVIQAYSSNFTYNTASYEGGGICSQYYIISLYNGCIFSNNAAVVRGGSFSYETCDVTFGSATISQNSAGYGGAVYSADSYDYVYDTMVLGNMATNSKLGGGAWYSTSSDDVTSLQSAASTWPRIYLSSTTFKNNNGSLGGAIYADTGCTIYPGGDAVFQQNKAKIHGGALYLTEFSLFFAPGPSIASFNNNIALTGGGGALFGFQSTVYLWDYMTFAGNTAVYGNNCSSFAISVAAPNSVYPIQTGVAIDAFSVTVVDDYGQICSADPFITSTTSLSTGWNTLSLFSMTKPGYLIKNGSDISFQQAEIEYIPSSNVSLSFTGSLYSSTYTTMTFKLNITFYVQPCAVGEYTIENRCFTCPNGEFSIQAGSNSCSFCTSLVTCSSGTIYPNANYQLYSLFENGTTEMGFQKDALQLQLASCPSDWCLSNNTCKDNHQGFSCAECIEGYKLWQGYCVLCDGTSGGSGIGGLVFKYFLLIAYVGYFFFVLKTREEKIEILGSVIFFLQTVSQLFETNAVVSDSSKVVSVLQTTSTTTTSTGVLAAITNNAVYQKAVSIFTVVSLQVSGLTNSCPDFVLSKENAPNPAFASFWVQLIQFPIGLAAIALFIILSVSFPIATHIFNFLEGNKQKTEEEKKTVSQSSLDIAAFEKDYWSRFIRCSLQVVSFIYTPILEAALGMINCKRKFLDESSSWVLDAEPTISCYVMPHQSYFILSILILIVLIAVYPAFLLYLLYKNIDRLDDHDFRRKYAKIYAPYKKSTLYWGVVVESRKTAVCIAVVFLRSSTGTLVFAVSTIFAFLIYLQAELAPFASREMNVLENVSLVLLLYISISVLAVPGSIATTTILLSVLLFLLVALGIRFKDTWMSRFAYQYFIKQEAGKRRESTKEKSGKDNNEKAETIKMTIIQPKSSDAPIRDNPKID